MAAVEQQVRVGIEDACARARRRDQPRQHRRHLFRIDREFQILVVRNGRDALAGLQLQQLLRIDGDGVGVDRCRSRDGTGDDLALRQEAFDTGIDQALAELIEIENAADQNDEGGQIEEQDAPRQARKDGIAEDAADQDEGMSPAPARDSSAARAFRVVYIPVLHQLCQAYGPFEERGRRPRPHALNPLPAVWSS